VEILCKDFFDRSVKNSSNGLFLSRNAHVEQPLSAYVHSFASRLYDEFGAVYQVDIAGRRIVVEHGELYIWVQALQLAHLTAIVPQLSF